MNGLYDIMYDYIDYTDDNGYEEKSICEEFKGSWTELQDHIKQMRKQGCYNITAAEVRM